MRFLRTIRFDDSDDYVFDRAAAPGEWAVSGAFSFANLARDAIAGKVRQAFANGFLGIDTFGRSTFSVVAQLEEPELRNIRASLARHFVDSYGAPSIESALPAAEEEAQFIMDLCSGALVNTVFTVSRRFDDEGEIHEEFRTIQAPGAQPLHTRIWSVVDDDG